MAWTDTLPEASPTLAAWTDTLPDAARSGSYVPPMSQDANVHSDPSGERFMQRVIDVAGPSPDVVQVLNPIYSPRYDPHAHNVVWAASTRDQRVEQPLEDAEQRRRRKWEG